MAESEIPDQDPQSTPQAVEAGNTSPNLRKYGLLIIVGVVLVFVLLAVVLSMATNRSSDTPENSPAATFQQATGTEDEEESEIPSDAGSATENDAKRSSDINAIMNAAVLYTNDGNTLPESLTTTPKNISTAGVDMCQVLYPKYIAAIPRDPGVRNGEPILECSQEYDTGYTMHIVDVATNQVQLIIEAPQRQGADEISALRVVQKTTLSNFQP